MQQSLFDIKTEPRAPPAQPKPKPAVKRLEFRRLTEPWGTPDKRGKYLYEKFHAEVMRKYGEAAHRRFFDMLLTMDADTFASVIEIGGMWNKLSVRDQVDYEDAIGLRG